jgi:hypothetical protein
MDTQGWTITIDSIAQDSDNPNLYDVAVTYANPATGNSYTTTPPYRVAPNINDLNTVIEGDLAAFQAKDAFITLSAGSYTLPT